MLIETVYKKTAGSKIEPVKPLSDNEFKNWVKNNIIIETTIKNGKYYCCSWKLCVK